MLLNRLEKSKTSGLILKYSIVLSGEDDRCHVHREKIRFQKMKSVFIMGR